MCHSLLQRSCRLLLLSGLLVTSVIASPVDASSRWDHDRPAGGLLDVGPGAEPGRPGWPQLRGPGASRRPIST